MNKKIIQIEYKISTPMFMSGANNKTQAEIRAPSIKGALRFWYRAIDTNYTKHEKQIFGSSDKGFGQSQFLLQITDRKIHTEKATGFQGLQYLGYGVSGDDARLYIRESSRFKLKLLFKPNTSPKDIERVQRSLWAMTMFGGLGSRSRKGFGSITAIKATGMEGLPSLFPQDKTALEKTLQEFIQKHISINTSSLPEHSCWSNETRCIVFSNSTTGELALKKLEKIFFKYRSSQSPECLAWAINDKDELRDFADTGNPPSAPPLRSAFGLPHNYFFSDLRVENVDTNLMEKLNITGRRASPLFFSIHQFSNNQCCITVTFLKARFIPKNKEITLTAWRKAGNRKIVEENTSLPSTNNYRAITDFLDKISNNEHQGVEIS